MANTVLVIGRLGELVKKIVELEAQIRDTQDKSAMIELTAYNQVLAVWPVEDELAKDVCIADFRILFSRFSEAWEDFQITALTQNPHRLGMDSLDYVQAKNRLAEKLKTLNALGRFVGDIPEITLEDSDDTVPS